MMSWRLASADRGHGVDGLDPGLHQLVDWLAAGDPHGAVDSTRRVSPADDRALVVDRLAERVHHAADHCLTDRDAEQFAVGGGDPGLAASWIWVYSPRMMTPTEFSSRLKASPLTPFWEGDHLAGHHAREAVDPGDPVADLERFVRPRSW